MVCIVIAPCSRHGGGGTSIRRRIRRLGHRAALSTALLATSACRTWSPVPASAPAPGTARRLPDPVRVTRVDGVVQELRHGVLSRDSLMGYAYPAGTGDSVRVVLARTAVRSLHGHARTGGTVLAVLVGVLLMVFVALTIAAHGF